MVRAVEDDREVSAGDKESSSYDECEVSMVKSGISVITTCYHNVRK